MPIPEGQAPIKFGEWLPDNATLSTGVNEAKGVYAQQGDYTPILSPLRYNGTSAATSSTCIGAFGCFDAARVARIFLGDKNKLYWLVNKVATDISKTGGYTLTADQEWVFEQFGSYVVAFAAAQNPQLFLMGTSTQFRDIGGTPPQADTVGRVSNFLVLGLGTTLSWSGQNNIETYTPDPTTQAGNTTLPIQGGDIKAIVSGEVGTIFQERQIQRMTYTGPPTIWDLAVVEEKRGCISRRGWAKWGRNIFYVAEDGFYIFDGYQSRPIGQNRIDSYFLSNLNYGYRHRVLAGIDPIEKVVWFVFPTGAAAVPSQALLYSITDDRWTHDDVAFNYFFEMPREGYTVETLDTYPNIGSPPQLDLIPVSLDSPSLLDGRRAPAGIDSSNAIVTFTGPARPAILETTEFEPAPGRRAFVSEIWPIVDCAPAGLSASVRARASTPGNQPIEGQISIANAIGCCPVRVDGRFLRARLYIGAGNTWTHAIGVHHDARITGAR